MDDIFYVPEIEMVDENVSLAIVDTTVVIDYKLDMDVLDFTLCCKDSITKDVFLETISVSNTMMFDYETQKDDIVDTIANILPEYEFINSLVHDDVNIVVPNRSFTIDRVISFKPFKIIVLLRGD